MPSNMALLLCTVLVAYLLSVDRKRSPGVSCASWVPTIWVMIMASRMVSLWFAPGSQAPSPGFYLEGSPTDRVVFLILIIAAGIILLRRNVKWSVFVRNNQWILLFFLYLGVSICWSDYPSVSFKRYVKGVGGLAMVLVVLTDPGNPGEALKAILRRLAYVLLPLSVVLYKYFPSLGRVYHPSTGHLMITGVGTGKNKLGLLCLVTGLFLSWQLISKWRNRGSMSERNAMWIDGVLLSTAVWLLIKTDSATSLISFIVGVGLLLAFAVSESGRNRERLARSVLVVSLALTPLLFVGRGLLIGSIVGATGHTDTFWGRVEFWPELIGMMSPSRHIIGEGYRSFWLGERLTILWNRYWWHPNEAHNGYVEILLDFGYIGLVLLAGIIIVSYRNIGKVLVRDRYLGGIAMTYFLTILLYNTTEAAWDGIHLLWFIFLTFAIRCSPPGIDWKYRVDAPAGRRRSLA